MKKYILIVLLFVNSQLILAQKLSFEDLTNTFELSYDELVVNLKTKGYELFRKKVSSNGDGIYYTFRLTNRLNGAPSSLLFFNTYKPSKRDTFYNYQLQYTTTSLEDFKQFETFLIDKKYKKSDDKKYITYSNGDYSVDFETIKITSTLNSYRISITNYTIGMVLLEILAEKTITQ
ncbi:hypothetical protein [Chryseobacterium turcicum]|uniref:Uncharacterized protein n=1 Tax=Chryseobacterium turcicum TaxID=2898076 RepID=A0A9Q3V6X4_9FLAO|nr:hypothetical protein [Chryseobacterium turcicum]MCD1118580.1 hypothetical protein [Chryseobacterium turcicum]